jgi:hypothetical protein
VREVPDAARGASTKDRRPTSALLSLLAACSTVALFAWAFFDADPPRAWFISRPRRT